MDEPFLKRAVEYLRERRKSRYWKNLMICMASLVVFVTSYALILPAITLEGKKEAETASDAAMAAEDFIMTASNATPSNAASNAARYEWACIASLDELEENEWVLYNDANGRVMVRETLENGLGSIEPDAILEDVIAIGDEDFDSFWSFEQTGEKLFAVSCGEQYLNLSGKAASLSDMPQELEAIVDEEKGTIQISCTEEGKRYYLYYNGGREGDGWFVTENPKNSNSWISLYRPGDSRQGKKYHVSCIGEDYEITVTYDEQAELPEDVNLTVREIKAGSDEYEGYCRQAAEAIQEGEEKPLLFARFFDIQFVADGEAIEPAAPVEVKISYREGIEVPDGEMSGAVHFAEDGTEVLEVLTEGESSRVDSFSFTQNSFSVTGTIVTGRLTTEITAGDGQTYRVTVTYDQSAGLPQGVILSARELEAGSEEYRKMYEAASLALQEKSGEGILRTRFFDISILDGEQEIEPKAEVSVELTVLSAKTEAWEEMQVVHAVGQEAVLVEEVTVSSNEEEVTASFCAEGFSAYGVVISTPVVENGEYIIVAADSDENYYAMDQDGRATPVEYDAESNQVTADESSLADISWVKTGSGLRGKGNNNRYVCPGQEKKQATAETETALTVSKTDSIGRTKIYRSSTVTTGSGNKTTVSTTYQYLALLSDGTFGFETSSAEPESNLILAAANEETPVAGGDSVGTVLPDGEKAPSLNPANEWQVVAENYDDDVEYTYSDDYSVRYRKKVEATGTENEFRIHLTVEPRVVDFQSFLDEATFGAVHNNSADLGGGVNTNSGWSPLYTEAQYVKAGKPDNWHEVYIKIKFNGEVYVSKRYVDTDKISAVNNGNVGLWSASSNLDKNGNKVIDSKEPVALAAKGTVSWAAMKGKYTNEIDLTTNDLNQYLTVHREVAYPTLVTDPMGSGITYKGIVEVSSGTVTELDESNEQILTWTFPEEAFADTDKKRSVVKDEQTLIYYKNAYTLVYAIQLTEYESCGLNDDGEPMEQNIVDTNGGTTLTYRVDTESVGKENGKTTGEKKNVEFTVPQVRGLKYELRLKKTDGNGNALSEVEFELTMDSSTEAGSSAETGGSTAAEGTEGRGAFRAITDSDGRAVFENLPWGTYTLAETQPPEGYIPAQLEKSFTLCYTTAPDKLLGKGAGEEALYSESEAEGPDGLIEIVNLPYRFAIKKVDAGNPETVLSGAEFTLTTLSVDDGSSRSGISDESGMIYFQSTSESLLLPGEYSLEETKAPFGYKAAESAKVTIYEDGSVTITTGSAETEAFAYAFLAEGVIKDELEYPAIAVSDQRRRFAVHLIKTDQNGTTLPGAVLILKNGETPVEPSDSEDTTKDDGAVVFAEGMVEPGTVYTITETETPDGYYPLEADIRFKLVEDESAQYGVALKTENDEAWPGNEPSAGPSNKLLKMDVVTDSENGEEQILELRVMNLSGTLLPNTGGPGISAYTLSGIFLLAGAAFMYYECSKKRRMEGRHGKGSAFRQ